MGGDGKCYRVGIVSKSNTYLYRMELKHQEGIILDNYHQLVNNYVDTFKVQSWRDSGFMLKDYQGLMWHSLVCESVRVKIDSIKNSEDLAALSDELQFITGQLYMYRTHILDSTLNPMSGAESLFYPKQVNYAEGMFNLLVNQAYQTCYNFWDRIGDLINPFLPNPLSERSVDFTRVINATPAFLNSMNFEWLKNYCENEYKLMNEARRTIVHHEMPSTSEMFDHLKAISNKDAIKSLYEDKIAKADYFKQKCAEQLDGLFYCLSFLDEINNRNGVPESPTRNRLKVNSN